MAKSNLSIQVHLDPDGVARTTFRTGVEYDKVFYVELSESAIQDIMDIWNSD